jgi:FtsP/CotA-like multicopper oxidase with cupredoxin domain
MRNSTLISFMLFFCSLFFFLGTIETWGAAPYGPNPGIDYSKPNFAYSPPLRKFMDSLPGLGRNGGTRTANTALGPSTLGQYLPIATATTPPAGVPNDADYYVIALVEYREQLHRDLPSAGTKLRGYVQLVPSDTPNAVALTTANGLTANITEPGTGDQLYGADKPHYLGPVILATKNTPVRVLFRNMLPPTSAGGNLFLPVDTTLMGAGMGPKFSNGADCDPSTQACASFTQNRATIHLHGGIPPWISDGTAHQWIVPAGEFGQTPYLKGASQNNVPDMPVPPDGSATFYWTNQQGGRLMFYHDHVMGMTRLNVYAGEAAGYLLVDPAEDALLVSAGVPGTSSDLDHLIPLVIQDRTFVYDASVTPVGVGVNSSRYTAATDPLWTWGNGGDLWFPHVYIPNQDPTVLSGANPYGRWDYGPWFWPVFPVASPYPPTLSAVPEAFMDTPVINGAAYPYLEVAAAKYRLRILNASNDRMFNLQFYQADPNNLKEVKMVPAALNESIPFPDNWLIQTPGMIPDILDGRPGGVPDPRLRGPAMIQIGTEGGLLPSPVLLLNTPVGYEQNKRNIVVGNVAERTLFLAPAERADIIVDFTPYAGKTIILYNDSPAPVPAGDPRYDFYTGNLDYSATAGANNQGGAPSTLPGYGPNTRTIMQFRVAGADPSPENPGPVDYYSTSALDDLQNTSSGLPAIYVATQDAPVVPQTAYPATYNSANDTYARIQDNYLKFTPIGSPSTVSIHMKSKAIQELFDMQGRMNATLGVELPFTGALIQTTVPLGFSEPTTETIGHSETQLWKITHNGVDTHGIHFHLVNVQVINRVGWDGAIRPPDDNELGWKETVRMNPLEDIIVAMKAKVPTFPFSVPNSNRPIDVTKPVNSTFTSLDPLTGNPITVTNAMTDFGHEYTWHCHILGHEDNDMMRPFVLTCGTPPANIDGTVSYFTTILAADNAATVGQTVKVQQMDLVESPNITNAASIYLKGGYTCDFLSNPGLTTVLGTLTIRGGPVVIENILIR